MAWRALPLWVGIAGAIAVLGFVLGSELRLQGKARTVPPSSVEGDHILTGFHLFTLRDGTREWEISATRARLFERNHQALLDMVRGTVRMNDGSVVEFEGQTALFDTASQDLRITGERGGAVVRLPNGYVLRTDQLQWVHARGELVSDDAVSLSGPHLSVQGVGVRIRPATQELTILNRVRADVL